jgi:hypothetical protein
MANVGSDDDGEEELSTVDQQRSVSCSPCFRMTKTERLAAEFCEGAFLMRVQNR